MSDVPVQKVVAASEQSLPVFRELDAVINRIRERAFSIAADSGFRLGQDLDNWLSAEKSVCGLACELVEQNGRFKVSVALPGFDAKDIEVTATPAQIIVKASRGAGAPDPAQSGKSAETCVHWSEFQSIDAYRRIELPAEIDVARCTARLDKGMLIVEVPRKAADKSPAATATAGSKQAS